MVTSLKDRLFQDLEKVKSEGIQRSERIRNIFQSAVSQAVDQIKGGTTELGSIAQGTVVSVIDNVKEQVVDVKTEVMNLADSNIPETETTPSWKTRLASLLKSIRQNGQLDNFKQGYEKLQEQWGKLDSRIAERYGDRYASFKQQVEEALERVRNWYVSAKTSTEADIPDPVQQLQLTLEAKVAEAGSAAAVKEAEVIGEDCRVNSSSF
mgnify:CR=1 FL=1